ncbi:MAG: YjjG family noncanonical pyrimidine nucleotidase [Clostridia bacterium]|nr:YjjG family noncanonical pyrimidine nucleotidase [Clostridia bacterium]
MIKTVFIDIDNTLLDFNKNSALAMNLAFQKNGLEFKEEYGKTFIKINDRLWDAFERQELTRAEIYEVRYKLILKELGLIGDHDKIEREYREFLFNCAEKVDGAEEILEYLSKKYRLFAASNAIKETQLNRLNKAGFLHYFDDVVVSAQVGVGKPSKQFFDACLEIAKCKKEDAIMLGDSLSADIKGAYGVGIKSIWYNHNAKLEPIEKLYDYKIDKLTEIKNIL